MQIEVTLVKTITYRRTYDMAAFAEVVGQPDASEDELVRLLVDESSRDDDYGIVEADDLTDEVEEGYEDESRTWDFRTIV